MSAAPRRRTALALAAQAATGKLFLQWYHDVKFALDVWRLNDPLTLFAGVPLPFVSLAFARRGSLRGTLVLLGAMRYVRHNYNVYLFGAALNVHFLPYVALFILSGLVLIAGLSAIDTSAIGVSFQPRTPVRIVAAYMAFWAAALGVARIGRSLLFALSGWMPEYGEGPTRPIAARTSPPWCRPSPSAPCGSGADGGGASSLPIMTVNPSGPCSTLRSTRRRGGSGLSTYPDEPES